VNLDQKLLVFVSAFAAPEEGAIHACHLDLDTGSMELLDQTIHVEFPFFMALSSDRRFLYANHAPTRFGAQDEQVII